MQNRLRTNVLCLFTFMVFGFSSPTALAADAVVVAAHGEVFLSGAKGDSTLKIGARVHDGETVKTGSGGLLILSYADGSRFKLKENSRIVIHAPGPAETGPSGVELVAGAMFALVSKQEKPHFAVKTKTAVAGVRGTEFFTSLGEKDAFWLCVQDGAVDVTPSEAKTVLTVPKGLGVLVERGKEPSPPRPYAWTEKLNWNMDPDHGDVVDTSSIESEYQNLLKQKYD